MADIVPYRTEHEPAVQAFNRRLAAAGITYAFPASCRPTWLPPEPGERLYQEMFLALDGAVVRGGYILKHQDFTIAGTTRSVGAFQLPLSEGIVDRAFAPIGVQLLRDALRRQPLMYTLGIGSREEAAARLLAAARFIIRPVPFYFRVERARPFLRNIQPFRRTWLARAALDLAAATGLGTAGLKVIHGVRTRRRDARPLSVSTPGEIAPAAQAVWESRAISYEFGAVRDGTTVARLYDRPGLRFLKVALSDEGGVRGWAVMLATQGSNHKYFGAMRIGSIVDLLVVPGYERALVDAAVDVLHRAEADIIVTNQSLAAVSGAVRGAGFLGGPSNFLFAGSTELVAALGAVPRDLGTFHLTRGDGDGPIHL